MKRFLIIAILLSSISSIAQVQREDGTWYDDSLSFHVVEEDLKEKGTMLLCIYNEANERCVHNLITPFEILIYDAEDRQIWNSAWSGQNPDIKFRFPMRGAAYIIIQSRNDYVVNSMTGTRIYTDGPLYLKYELQ